MVLAVVLGFGLGLVSGLRQNTALDSVAMLVALFGVSMPVFWLALLLIMLFAVHLQWLPATSLAGVEGAGAAGRVAGAPLGGRLWRAWCGRASWKCSSSTT